MKVLAVSGSPRIEKRSSTLKLVKAVAENTGCEYDLVSLAGKKFTGCIGCGLCLRNCSSNAIIGEPKKLHWIDQQICHKCGVCYEVCPPKFFSVEIRTGEEEEVPA